MRTRNSFCKQMKHVLLWFMLIGSAFGIVACGSVMQSSSSNSTHTAATATSISGVTMPAQVKVKTDKLQYTGNETLTITVKNGLSSSIYITAYQTNCTPLLLEGKKENGTWTAQNLCSRAQSASLQQLEAGAVTVYRLTPAFRHPGTAIRSTPWQAGTYRVSISYTLAPDADTVQSGTKVYAPNVVIA